MAVPCPPSNPLTPKAPAIFLQQPPSSCHVYMYEKCQEQVSSALCRSRDSVCLYIVVLSAVQCVRVDARGDGCKDMLTYEKINVDTTRQITNTVTSRESLSIFIVRDDFYESDTKRRRNSGFRVRCERRALCVVNGLANKVAGKARKSRVGWISVQLLRLSVLHGVWSSTKDRSACHVGRYQSLAFSIDKLAHISSLSVRTVSLNVMVAVAQT